MGARQRAQKRGQAAKGSQKGIPPSQKKLNSSMHVPDLGPAARSNALLGWQDFAQPSSPPVRKNLTMGDTARNTERHMFGWGPSKLRDQGITFVSAGTLHQDPEHVHGQEDKSQNEQHSKPEDQLQAEEDNDLHLTDKSTPLQPEIKIVPAVQLEPDRDESKLEVNLENLRPRSPSSSSSSSSSETEQIVFRGRSKAPTPKTASLNASKKSSRVPSPVKQAPKKEEDMSATIFPDKTGTKPMPIMKEVLGTHGTDASSTDQRVKPSRNRRRGPGRRNQSDIDEQEAIMRDYIANMAMDDSEDSEEQPQSLPNQPLARSAKTRKNETFRYYDGAGEENVKVQIQSRARISKRKVLDQAMDWNSDDLHDFNDLSTTDDEVDEVSQVLRQRERNGSRQFLVTSVGSNASDAKWMLHEKLVSESARREIAIFEEILAMEVEEETIDEDDEDEDEEEVTDEEAEEALNDLIDHIESEDDENARIMKHTARMSDEQIARALAKQEELGIGGDELVLFGGDFDEDQSEVIEEVDHMFGRNEDFVPFSLKQHTSNRTRAKHNKKNRDSFPSAAAFADALDEDPYGGFDVMDFDRPSLRVTKKGRKSDFPYNLELEDDDLRDQLVSTWMKDRDKKAQRKKDKEEARLAAVDKYADRSDPAAIKAEIRRFLVQEVDTLRLAPMESSVRASVHRLAKALRLNSRSEGKEGTAKGRFPVLTKTVRTPQYTIDNVWEVDALLNTRKFFPKGLYQKDKLPRGSARALKVRQSGGVSGATYMNGEVVGASAPEIGAENKGRAMLEKMGWTSGMAIGAVDNKGSLEAVKHVFRTSRAGLG